MPTKDKTTRLTTSSKVVSLFNYNQKESFLPYLVFQSHNPKSLQALSPDLMQITDSLFVSDLTIVKSYWQKVAFSQKLPLREQLKKVITKQISDCRLAVFCEHPFQGLVFFNHLKLQDTQGVFDSETLFAQKLYHNMSWQPWFLSARQLNDCFEKNSCLKKERKSFASDLQRLARFVERVDIQEFSGLKQAHFFELQRRFKGFIGKLWLWTFPQQDEEDSEVPSLFNFQHYQQLKGFPWSPFFQQEKVKIENWLEHPLCEWEQLQEPLFFDLEKICRHSQLQEPLKILQMSWSITLFDMSQVKQTLSFKNPLATSEELKSDFSILFKQLHFAFDRFKQQMKEREKELEIINIPLIVGWKLSVDKTLILSERSQFLDPDEQAQWVHKEELENISNKIRSPLQSFQICESFIPGLDFSEKNLTQEIPLPAELDYLNAPRPFYLLPKEEELDPEQIKQRQFLDRTSSDWWNRQDALDSYRDCFLCELESKEFVFAYRNYQGRWYQYGF